MIDLNVQRFEESPVVGANLGVTRFATRETNRRVQFQYDVEPGCAHARNRIRDARGFRHRVIDGMAKFAQQLFEMIVQLHVASLRKNALMEL